MLTLHPHLLLVFAQLSPHLSSLLRDLRDGDAWVLRLDSLAAGVKPKHVGTHRPLGSTSIFLLLLLTLKKEQSKEMLKSYDLIFVCLVAENLSYLS